MNIVSLGQPVNPRSRLWYQDSLIERKSRKKLQNLISNQFNVKDKIEKNQ
jgi:hypothetical protein